MLQTEQTEKIDAAQYALEDSLKEENKNLIIIVFLNHDGGMRAVFTATNRYWARFVCDCNGIPQAVARNGKLITKL